MNFDEAVAGEGMLSPFRVLDLTEGGCTIGAKMLGDLGADVIKVEPPGGSPTRSIGPYWHDETDPEKSLFWWAYNINKKSVTLNISSPDGMKLFKKLASTADFIFESFPPNTMDHLGLGYEAIAVTNPRVIMASITPFGPTGPKAHYAWSDLTIWSSGGPVYMTGDPDKAPVGISFMHQAALNAGAEAAAASMIAHYYRENTGPGQHIDVSMQEVAYWIMTSWQEFWETDGTIPKRFGGPPRHRPDGILRERRQVFPAKDGYVVFWVQGGWGGGVQSTKAALKWMDEEGMAPAWLLNFDWVRGFDLSTMDNKTLDALEQPFVDFFATKTKDEISLRAFSNHIMVGAVNNSKDLANHPHLKERGFFEEVAHEDLGELVTYCGPSLKASETPLSFRMRPPHVGEHNYELYGGELGITQEEIDSLRSTGVI
ncbi:MAG: hypothetical protein BZY82_10025 [SAR202 cluster bacterium Io17-Chloro-G3]|nr:MAG: hypothetical protein BZY82_10025 [SAR202 cluster bacterium Io17-Chloro-G3]